MGDARHRPDGTVWAGSAGRPHACFGQRRSVPPPACAAPPRERRRTWSPMTEGCRLGRRQREADQRRKTEFVSHAALRRRRGRFGRSPHRKTDHGCPHRLYPRPRGHGRDAPQHAQHRQRRACHPDRRHPPPARQQPRQSERQTARRQEQPALRPRRRSAERRRRARHRRVRAIPPRATPQPCAAAVRPRPSGQGGAPPDSGAARENPECPCQDAAMPRLSLYVLKARLADQRKLRQYSRPPFVRHHSPDWRASTRVACPQTLPSTATPPTATVVAVQGAPTPPRRDREAAVSHRCRLTARW